MTEKLEAVITQPEVLEAVVERMNQQLQDRKAPMAKEFERLMQVIGGDPMMDRRIAD